MPGMGASAADRPPPDHLPTTLVATFDTEPLIDQRARRPIARLEDGVTTELTWPTIRLVAGKDRAGADMLYLTGPEPDFRWRTFIEAVVELVRASASARWSGSARSRRPPPTPVRCDWPRPSRPQSADLAGRVGTVHGTLEVPAGVQAALEVALGQAGVPVIGLWARVPHYVSAMPYPEASAALIEGLCAVSGTVLDTSRCARPGRPPGPRWTSSSPPTPSTSRWSGGSRRPSTPKRAPARARHRGAERGRDRRRARAVPQRRRALNAAAGSPGDRIRPAMPPHAREGRGATPPRPWEAASRAEGWRQSGHTAHTRTSLLPFSSATHLPSGLEETSPRAESSRSDLHELAGRGVLHTRRVSSPLEVMM